LCLEIVVVALVPTAKTDPQRLLDGGILDSGDRSVDERTRGFVPEFQVALEVANLFRTEIDDRHHNFDGDRITFSVEIAAGVEVVLIDRRRAVDAIGAEREIDGLNDGRLPGVIVADQDNMPRQGQLPFGNPAKILDRKLRDAHGLKPRLGVILAKG
jgi:hypothetical protein